MANKKRFEKYLNEKKLVILEDEQKDSELSPVSLLEFICNQHRVVVGWLANAALFIRRHRGKLNDSEFKYKTKDGRDREKLSAFLNKLKEHELITFKVEWNAGGADWFSVRFPDDPRKLLFFRSKWAEASFRMLVERTVRHYLHQTNQIIPYRLLSNVKIKRVDDETHNILTELDLVLEIGKRFYVFEIKSGPQIRILQWALREALFHDSQTRVITCTTYPGIPPEIFEPQILLTFNSFEERFIKYLEVDFNVLTPKTQSVEALWQEHDHPSDGVDCLGGEDEYGLPVDRRTFFEGLEQDMSHVRSIDDCGCLVVQGYDGEWYADYDLNAQWD